MTKFVCQSCLKERDISVLAHDKPRKVCTICVADKAKRLLKHTANYADKRAKKRYLNGFIPLPKDQL